MYSAHNEGKSVIAEMFIKTLKSKIYGKMTENHLIFLISINPYLNKLVDQYNNTCHPSINKKLINGDYSSLIERIGSNPKAPKFKVNDEVRITNYKNIFSKDYTENWSREIFIIDSVLKTNLWTYRLKDLNGGKIIGSVYEKELLLIMLKISYYPEPESHIRDKAKVALDLSNYATKKELDHATGVDTSDLAAKKDLSLWKLKLTNSTLINLLLLQLVWII